LVPRAVSQSLAALAALAAIAVIAVFAGSASGSSWPSMSSLDTGVLQQLNQIRSAHGLVPLQLSPALDRSAAEHTREMGVDGYFEHNSANGMVFWKRIEHWYGSAAYGYWSVGENLLWSSPGVDAPGALRLWMSSPEHRANILAPRWRVIGVSALHFATAGGPYDGQPVTIITTDFGVRR
jgi:uncharacterized protein YkwD